MCVEICAHRVLSRYFYCFMLTKTETYFSCPLCLHLGEGDQTMHFITQKLSNSDTLIDGITTFI